MADHSTVEHLVDEARENAEMHGGEENQAARKEDNTSDQQQQPREGDVRENDEPIQTPETEDGDIINDLPENVSLLSQQEYVKLEKEHLQAIEFSPSETKYLSQYLLYLDRKKRVTSDEDSTVPKTVRNCIEVIKKRLQNTDFNGGDIVECGSYYENTKVGDPHEFDYQYIMPLENYEARVAQISKMKPKQSNSDSKAFFKLYKKGKTGEIGQEIVAKDRHDAFQSTVEGILKDLFQTDEPMTKKAGPAVKFVLKIPYDGHRALKSRNVKVDLTMAYAASPEHTFFGEVELRSYANLLRNQKKLQCHFIPAHDFWKLSFTRNEIELMNKVSAVNYKGVCYRAIKILRDEVDVQDTLGDGILSSYPIKVTHIKETLNTYIKGTDAGEWTRENVGNKVIEIAKAVDYDGQKHQMYGIFIRDDNIMGESDKSYMESRRILNKLKSISTKYKQYALLNCVIWLVMMVASTGLLAAEVVAWAVTDWWDLQQNCFNETDGDPPFPMDLPFLFAFSVLAWINVFANLTGLFLVTVVTNKWKKDIFMVLPNLRYVFLLTGIASLIIAAFDIFLIADYVRDETCTRLGNSIIIQAVAGVTIFITLVPYILLMISCISSSIYYRGMQKKSCSGYDVLFFEFPFCRERIEKLEHEKEEAHLTQDEKKGMTSLTKTVVNTLHCDPTRV